MITAYQIGQGHAVYNLGDGGLNLPPYLHSDTAVGPVAAAGALGTAHRGQISLQHSQNLTHRVLRGIPGEQIASAGAPDAAHQAGARELGDDLLQIFI